MKRKVLALVGGLSITGLALTIGVFGGSEGAIAQNCDAGTQSFQGAYDTSPRCVGIPGYIPPPAPGEGSGSSLPAQQPRPEPTVVSVPSYGAVAHDPTTGSIGAGGAEDRHESKESAEKAAMKTCQAANGGKEGCTIVASVKEACIMVSVGADKVTHRPNLRATVFQAFNEEEQKNAGKVCTDNNTDCVSKYFCAFNNISKTVRPKRFFRLF